MPVSRLVYLPGFSFPQSRRSSLLQVDTSLFQRELAKIAGRNGLTNMIDPDDFDGASLVDRMSGETWTLTGGPAPAATTIGSKPALTFVHGTTGWLASENLKAPGSFTLIAVYSQDASQALTASALLFGSGPGTTNLVHARTSSSAMRFYDTNAHANVSTGHAAGSFVTGFCYDADSGNGAVLANDGSVIASAAFNAPPSGYPWNIGGWQAGYRFDGNIGMVLILDRSLALAGNADLATELFDLIATEYGI